MAGIYTFIMGVAIMSIQAAFIVGWKFDPKAGPENYLFNVSLFAAFVAIHVITMQPWFKKTLFGQSNSTPTERRFYTVVSLVTWIGMVFLHKPMGGPGWTSPEWLQFVGMCALLYGFFFAWENANFEGLKGLMASPGMELAFSQDQNAPLFTEGSYASVRHPGYRGNIYMALASLIIHPNQSQLIFVVMFAATFIIFIPFEERALLRGRGDAYRDYMKQTPYRLFRGLW